jgi:hypothetical protein
MALPKIDTPIFELTLPLSKKKIKFRPFLVKEQKVLLMTKEANDKETIIRSMKQILQNCTLSEIDIDSLPIVDIEIYFLNLRARSVGEVVELQYKCENVVESAVCGNKLDASFNLLEIQPKNIENYTDTIMVTDKIGIKFKHPDFSLLESIKENETYVDLVTEVIINSIDYIFEGETFYYSRETPKQELLDFLESLSQKQFDEIENHFKSLPVLEKNIEIICSRCGFKHDIQLEGIDNFFV